MDVRENVEGFRAFVQLRCVEMRGGSYIFIFYSVYSLSMKDMMVYYDYLILDHEW